MSKHLEHCEMMRGGWLCTCGSFGIQPSSPAGGSTLTAADDNALSHIPEGWFRVTDLPYNVRAPYARCERLTRKGMLETRVVNDEKLGVVREWKKKLNTDYTTASRVSTH
jgi:hypothetical protein